MALKRVKKTTRVKKEKDISAEAKRRGTGHDVRDDYAEDSYRWCYRESAAPKTVSVTVVRINGKLVKQKVVVDGEVTYQA